MSEALKERYINVFTDFGFKRLFGSEPTKACLIDFLNSLLDGLESPIKELSFRNTEQLGASELDRKAYEQSLKYYRDMKNIIDTAVEEGTEALREEMTLALEDERRQKEASQKREEEERCQKEEERRQKELLKKKLIASSMTEEDIQTLLNG